MRHLHYIVVSCIIIVMPTLGSCSSKNCFAPTRPANTDIQCWDLTLCTDPVYNSLVNRSAGHAGADGSAAAGLCEGLQLLAALGRGAAQAGLVQTALR